MVALALGLSTASAVAAPPTLDGQVFHGSDDPFMGEGTTAYRTACRDNGDGTSTQVLDFAGDTPPPLSGDTSPFVGSYDEHVEMRLRASDPQTGAVDLLSLRADFNIRSSVGQVSGTKRLPAPVANATFPSNGSSSCGGTTSSFGLYTNPSLTLDYTATIVSRDGVFTDRGRASFNQAPARASGGRVYSEFDERFASSLSAPAQNESALFGPRVPGGSLSAMSANAKRASPFTLYYPATVRKVYAYVDGGGATSGSQTVRGVLYRNGAGNVPGGLVAPTFEFTVPARMSGRWVPLYLAPPTRLQPGVYWLGLQTGATNGVARFAWSSKTNSRRSNIDGYADGPSDPFGTGALDDQQMSILAAGNY